MINTSFRRYYLDQFLINIDYCGKVLDLGGKKTKKRGLFTPPVKSVESWEYLNIDKNTNPDYLCSAESIPISDNTYDIVLMTEVLEHLENPEIVLKEVFRVLKKGGQLVMTVPFLFPIHSDPYDYQRWTPYKINKELLSCGYILTSIEPMGGIIAVIMDLIHVSTGLGLGVKVKIIGKLIKLASGFLLKMDNKVLNKNIITTGYAVIAYK